MTIWIALPDLMNLNCLHRVHSSTNCLRVHVQYANATPVCTAFGCESMADHHHHIYLKCDVLLFADFFEKFCATGAVHYYTAPGLAWDAALRMSCVSLELVTDVNSNQGGISMISTRHAQDNSPSFCNTYDDSLPT